MIYKTMTNKEKKVSLFLKAGQNPIKRIKGIEECHVSQQTTTITESSKR